MVKILSYSLYILRPKAVSIAEFVIASGEARKKVRNRNKFYNISPNNTRNRKLDKIVL